LALGGVESSAALGDLGFSESGQAQAEGNATPAQTGGVQIDVTVAIGGNQSLAVAGSISTVAATGISGESAAVQVESISLSSSLLLTANEASTHVGSVVFFSNSVTVGISGVFSTLSVGSLVTFDASPAYVAVITVQSKPSATIMVEQQSASITVIHKPSAVLTRWI
jgi:hypothetical protein